MHDVEPGLAGGDDAEAPVARHMGHAVELVGARIGLRRGKLGLHQARFLLQRAVGPTDVNAVGRKRDVRRRHRLHACVIHGDGGRALDYVARAFQRHPRAAKARHREAVPAEVDQFLDTGGVQDRDHRRDERRLRLVRGGRGLGAVVVACQHEHAAVGRCAGEIAVLQGIPRPVNARPFAIPDREHAVVLGALP